MEQSGQPQQELIIVTPSLLSKTYLQLQDARNLLGQDQHRLAVLAFIEYIKAFQEAIDKAQRVPFDTGEYDVGNVDLSSAVYFLAGLLNESLRKKTIARIGKKLMGLGEMQSLIRYISSYLGFYNIALADSHSTYSLAHLLYERPVGYLEPLTDEEWQALSEKAVADMLERRQMEGYTVGLHRYFRENESETNFSDKRSNRFCRYFGATKKYPFANDEAKHAAEEIVAIEKVRLNLFLEALQGTLRFLDRLTRLPNYTEVQLVFDVKKDRAKVAAEMIDLLKTLVGESVSLEEGSVNKDNQKTNIVESESTVFPPQGAVCRVIKVEHQGLSYIYHIELTDPGILPEPCEFTLTFNEGSSIQDVSLQEVERDE